MDYVCDVCASSQFYPGWFKVIRSHGRGRHLLLGNQVYGQVKVRDGFEATQQLRRDSTPLGLKLCCGCCGSRAHGYFNRQLQFLGHKSQFFWGSKECSEQNFFGQGQVNRIKQFVINLKPEKKFVSLLTQAVTRLIEPAAGEIVKCLSISEEWVWNVPPLHSPHDKTMS